ncbi:MAG: M48 family metalloprotease [Usitatibacter sp.]
MRTLLTAALLAACLPASAQFGGLGNLLNKGVETVKKTQEANREFTTDDEVALGTGITAGVLGASKLHPDQNLQRYVNRVGKWLAMHSDRPGLPWSFGVIDTETINAFAMPGGMVIISSGLLKNLGSEAELAGALAHEIAHVVMKHQLAAIRSSMNSDILAGIGKEVAGQAISNRVGGNDAFGLKSAAGGALASAGVDAVKNGVFLRPLDRGMEYDADRLGVVIAARSGYDPYGLVGVLQVLSQLKSDGGGAAIFDTHPAAGERIDELEKFMPTIADRLPPTMPQLEARFKQVVK